MKLIQSLAFAITLTVTFAMLSCNDPLQIGAELIDGGDVDFVSTDTITIEALTTVMDSIRAYEIPNFIFANQRLGWINDPIFGSHRSDLIIQLFPENFIKPEGLVDSVVLAIQYDTSGIYGNPDATFDFEVLRIMGQLNRLGTFYVDDVLPTSTSLGVVTGFNPTDTDSIEIVEINSIGDLDTMQVPNQMRLKLNNDFGDLLFSIDSLDYAVIDSFFNTFSGLKIKPTSAGGAMLSLISSSTTAIGGTQNSKVSVFYKDDQGEPRQYDYFIGGATFTSHEHDYSTGSIAGSINDPISSEDLLYLQGAGGPIISIKLPHIQSLTNVVVNEAILELTTELLPQDDRSWYPLPAQIYPTFNQDSLQLLIGDFSTAIQVYGDVDLAGGKPIEATSGGITSIVYRLNMSDHIQGMIDGSFSNEIIIQLSNIATGVERAVFKGINDPESPIRLKITYTEI